MRYSSTCPHEKRVSDLLVLLLVQMRDFLSMSLCASILERKIFVMPFNRDVRLDERRVAAMRDMLEYCKQAGGALLVAPEHRLSLKLKWHELLKLPSMGETCAALSELDFVPMHELLDESDEILRHKWQLVYACGNQIDLPTGMERWHAAEAILRIVRQSSPIQELLETPGLVARDGTTPGSQSEAFEMVRLIHGEILERYQDALIKSVAVALFENPPYEFEWVRGLQGADIAIFIDFVTQPSQSTTVLPMGLSKKKLHALLAIRGFLACGVFIHCMQKRHRVHFGVDPGRKQRSSGKVLAVPFRASNTPSERSEFGHPDCAILLTVLSYYSDGLSEYEVKTVFQKLLECSDGAQADLYRCWYLISHDRMTPEERESLKNVLQLDMTNEEQALLLFKCFRFNFETINFFLNQLVFPSQTQQFPHKLVANAWHLTDHRSGLVNGFSGTNDNAKVLPAHVSQIAVHSLAGTNGMMLRLMLANPVYLQLPDQEVVQDQLIQRASKYHALIDAGALLSGQSNLEIAKLLLPLVAKQRRGVVFFDAGTRQWMILDCFAQCKPKKSSPVREQECFAFFDESRSRGADLKLPQTARALVTIGPGMCKDKIMQALGRMRMLDKGQTADFIGTSEITKKVAKMCHSSTPKMICSACGVWKDQGTFSRTQIFCRRRFPRCKTCVERGIPSSGIGSQNNPSGRTGITSKDVMQWVMRNTVAETERAFVEWARQGALFVTTKDAPELAVLNEDVSLETFYSSALDFRSAAEVIENDTLFWLNRSNGQLQPSASNIIATINETGKQYGQQLMVLSSSLDEECERELEKEIEKEKEVEVAFAKQEPCSEVSWEYSEVFEATSARQLPHGAGVQPIAAAVDSTEIGHLHWPWPDSIFCTRNFRDTIRSDQRDAYLRFVDSLIQLKSGELLLISPREESALLEIFWSKGNPRLPSSSANNTLVRVLGHFWEHGASGDSSTLQSQHTPAFASLSFAASKSSKPALLLPLGARLVQSLRSLVALLVFAGETTYSDAQLAELRLFLMLDRGISSPPIAFDNIDCAIKTAMLRRILAAGRAGNHYAVLGATPNDSIAEIRGRYRKVALKVHPDKCRGFPEAEDAIKMATDAVEILTDEAARARYDRAYMGGTAPEARAVSPDPDRSAFNCDNGQLLAKFFVKSRDMEHKFLRSNLDRLLLRFN